MSIDTELLIEYGGIQKKINKGEFIFFEGENPRFFHQIIIGEVKLFSTNGYGKELIQRVFKCGNSFGEPPLLLDKPYPSTAQATTTSVIIRICKKNLLNLLNDHPEMTEKLLLVFAERIYSKSLSVNIWVSRTPEEKILNFLNKIRRENLGTCNGMVPYTRQQIADFTGLRVETVIRTLIKMKKEKKIDIIDHKLYYA